MDKENIRIRAMEKEDIDLIIKNYEEQSWPKKRSTLEKYLASQTEKQLYVFIAEVDKDVAGYTVLYLDTAVGPFANMSIPLIGDFIVFIKYQRLGIGNRILDAVEEKAFELNDKVQLSVGLHSGYGAAQRIYIKRGYIPDGSGCWYNNQQLEQYADCNNNDDLVLYLLKTSNN